MHFRSLFPVIIFGAGLMTCSAVQAEDLKVSNSSKYDLSFQINDICSNGFIENHSIKIISEKSIQEACKSKPEKCVITVFDAQECKGKQVGSIELNTHKGVQLVRANSKNHHPIKIGGSLFNVFFAGPWE